ncbi:MAG: FHA domain-containing protein [bacterium]|nr:FHA domain-containing protein [bacterium]MDT8395092.1 FHA domain-containing protein [bacterium]
MPRGKDRGFEPTHTMPRRERTVAKDPEQRAHLVPLTGSKAGTHYPVLDDRMTILGRDPQCQIRLEDPDASRRHAAIQPFGREFYIMDMGSTNGTLINGHLEEKRILRHGDKITIGKQVFQFLLTAPDGSPILISPTG